MNYQTPKLLVHHFHYYYDPNKFYRLAQKPYKRYIVTMLKKNKAMVVPLSFLCQQQHHITPVVLVVSPIVQCQRRYNSIISYITNLFQGSNNQNPFNNRSNNPLLEILQYPIENDMKNLTPIDTIESVKSTSSVTSASTTTTTTIKSDSILLPKLSLIRPYHMKDAFQYVQQVQIQYLHEIIQIINNYNSNHHSNNKSNSSNVVTQQQQQQLLLESIIYLIDKIQQPYYIYRQIGSLLYTLSNDKDTDKSDWYDALQQQQQQQQQQQMTLSTSSPLSLITFPITNITTSTTDNDIENNTSMQWYKVHETIYNIISNNNNNNNNHHDDEGKQQQETKTEDQQSDLYIVAQRILQQYANETGIHKFHYNNMNSTHDNDDRNNTNVQNNQVTTTTTKYIELNDILYNDIKNDIDELRSTNVSLKAVQIIYNYLGIRNQQIQLLLGYNNTVVIDSIFHNATTTMNNILAIAKLNDIHQLHDTITKRLYPILQHISDRIPKRTNKETLEMESYLTSTGSSNSNANNNKTTTINNMLKQQYYHDRRSMIQLEHHVTLNGVLQFTFRLINDIFGISITECNDENDNNNNNNDNNKSTSYDIYKWNDTVRLYHCYDTLNDNVYIGSIYLDPSERDDSTTRPVTIPIIPRSEYVQPIVVVHVPIRLPVWDTDPIMVSWNDCESILHEFGHAIQYITSKSKHGCIVGVQNIPLDISEFIPKFMELWMTQRSTLYALIDMSNSTTPLSDESIDAAYRVKAREKVMKLAELTLYGTLELELFSTFDIKGNETILALQERLTETIMPHIEYDKTDMTVLLDIIEDNVHGRHVAWYRYLWCEVHAAALMELILQKMSSSASSDTESISQIRLLLRQHILEPGANINYTAFQTELGISDVTLEPLWKLHGLSTVDKVLPETIE